MGTTGELCGSFLESVVFWLYLNYFGLVVRSVLALPLLPSSVWDKTLTSFVCSFVVDYVWRRGLYVGYCIDPSVTVIRYAQKTAPPRDVLHMVPMSIVAGLLVYLISEAVYPVRYARMDRSRGLFFCFCFELAFDSLHQTRNALYLLMKDTFTRNRQRGTSPRPAEFQPAGMDIMASFMTASLVSIGGYFSFGGPMMHLSYTTMASVAARDWCMFLLLGTANVLAGYVAGRYVQLTASSVPLTEPPFSPLKSPPSQEQVQRTKKQN